jgi:hypothetical protein
MAPAAEIGDSQPTRQRLVSPCGIHGQIGIAFIEAASRVSAVAILTTKSHIAMDIA